MLKLGNADWKISLELEKLQVALLKERLRRKACLLKRNKTSTRHISNNASPSTKYKWSHYCQFHREWNRFRLWVYLSSKINKPCLTVSVFRNMYSIIFQASPIFQSSDTNRKSNLDINQLRGGQGTRKNITKHKHKETNQNPRMYSFSQERSKTLPG